MSVTVAVRDAITRAPVVGAAVHVRSLHFHVPAPPYGKVGGGAQLATTVYTNDAGEAQVPWYEGLPMQVIVVTPDSAPLIQLVELPSPLSGTGEPTWVGRRDPGRGDPSESPLEVQIRFPSAVR